MIVDHLNAAGLRMLDGVLHRAYGPRKALLLDEPANRILEIGPGVGANFRYMRTGTSVIAVEPSRAMYPGLRRSASRYGIALEILETGAETIDVEDNSVDTILSTLVLCSVDDVERCLSEIQRVLRPGGRFLFIEHVGAEPGSVTNKIQRAIRLPWRALAGGCRLDRDLETAIRAARFAHVELQTFDAFSKFSPVHPHIQGSATR